MLLLKFIIIVLSIQLSKYLFSNFRAFANHFQVEVHQLLVALGKASNWEVGRQVDSMGDCYFDAFLAQLEDPRIRKTIHPLLLRGITTPQGSIISF